jgi:hypothetical protein
MARGRGCWCIASPRAVVIVGGADTAYNYRRTPSGVNTRSTRKEPITVKHLVLQFLLLALLGTSVNAGRNWNGALVVHTDDSVIYSTTENYCETPSLPSACEMLNANAGQGIENAQVIWLLAAFLPQQSPAVAEIQFGIRHNLPVGQDYFAGYASCLYSGQQQDPGWPETGFGNIVAFSPAVTDCLFRFYWFALYVDGPDNYFGTCPYPGTNEAKFVDDGNPPVEDLCTNFGTVRWDGTGRNYCPEFTEPAGACCFPDGSCRMAWPEWACTDQGGVYQGDGMPCDPNPCTQPSEACCHFDGSCTFVTAEQCAAEGGMAMGYGTNCDPNPCEDNRTGACCLDMNGNCVILRQADCYVQGGEYQGPDAPCEPNPCFGFPSEHVSWGRIKVGYR